MTSDVESPAAVSPSPAAPKIRAYLRLAKLDIIDYYLALPVALTLLAPAQRLSSDTLLTLLLFGLGELCVIAASVAFDDVTGYRDGSDAANYGPDAPRRRLARKPLLAGTLTPAEAIRFGWWAAVAGALLWGGATAVAPHRSTWAIVVGALCLVTAVQYSWGLKISYRGWQEVFLFGFGVGMVLVPYGLLSSPLTGFAVLQAVLFGAGPMLFGLYSNTNDIEGDARVGRPTVAVLASPRGNAAFIAAMTLAQIALVGCSAWVGPAPWWFPLAMLPVIALRLTELDTAFRRRDILPARRIAIRTHRVSVVLLIAVNLALPLLSVGTP